MKSIISVSEYRINRIRKYVSTLLLITIALIVMGNVSQVECREDKTSSTDILPHRWVSSVSLADESELCIAIHDGKDINLITKGFRDHKPVCSKENGMITFIRTAGDSDTKKFHKWRANVCVINSDGTGFKELTDNSEAYLNPTWTKDGSNRIIFNQLTKSGLGIKFFWTRPGAEKGSAELLSKPYFVEWAECGLEDGRILTWRLNRFAHIFNLIVPFWSVPGIQKSYALDPVDKSYEPIKRSRKHPWHRLNFSPSGKKVTYMKDMDGKLMTYLDCVIAYADFDSESLTVSNEVTITSADSSYIDMYPKWSPDEAFILISSDRSGNMLQYAYSLESRKLQLVSGHGISVDKYALFENCPN